MINLNKPKNKLDSVFKENQKVAELALEELKINGVKLIRELREAIDKPPNIR